MVAHELTKPCHVDEAKDRLARLHHTDDSDNDWEYDITTSRLPNGTKHGPETVERGHGDDMSIYKKLSYKDGKKHGIEEEYENGCCTLKVHWIDGKIPAGKADHPGDSS